MHCPQRPNPPQLTRLCLGALVLSLPFVACGQKEKTTPGGNSKGPSIPLQGEVKRESKTRVQVAPVVQKEMVRTLSITRAIESEFENEVLPRTTGTVIELLVQEGDRVQADQVLAKIDDREAQASLRDAKLALQEAKNAGPRLSLAVREAEEVEKRAKLTHQQANRDYERNKSAGFVSSSDLEKLELTRDQAYRDWQSAILGVDRAKQELENQGAIIDRALLAVEKAELELSHFEIKAPFDGVIAERMVNIGASVGPSAGVFLLTDPDQLRAVLYRPQKELEFFQRAAALQEENQDSLAIMATPEAYSEVTYPGHIRRVSPIVDSETGSVRVTVDLEQPGPQDAEKPRLMPGMMVRIGIVTERVPDALVVEKRALRREGDRRYIFVVRDGKAERIDVTEGLLGEVDVQVTPVEGQELSPDEPVVTIGGRDLEPGQGVQIAGERNSDSVPQPEEGQSAGSKGEEKASEGTQDKNG